MTQEGDKEDSAKALCQAESSDGPAFTASATEYDFLGRAVSVSTPLGVTSNFYDGASDRLVRVSRTGQPDTLYAYDGLGNVSATATDADGDGQITAADRVSSFGAGYEEDASNVWWRVTAQAQSCGGVTNNSSVTREQLTGLSDALQSRTVTAAHSGAVTAVTKSLDPATRVVTETSLTDSATPAVRRTLFGCELERSGANGAALSGYDGFARAVSQTVTNGTGTVSTLAAVYDTLGNAVTNTATYGDHAAVSSVAYDAQGRAVSQTDALGGTVDTAYDSLGQTLSLSGATYPVTYAYDTAGRKVALSTARDGVTPDTTHWLYDGATGLLTNKVYADGSRIGYAYSEAGALSQKTWARGAWVRYGYDALGQVTNRTYSGIVTPSVALAYDAAGLLSLASDSSGLTHGYAYNGRASVTNETVTRTNATWVISRFLDDRERPSVTAVSADGTNAAATAYGYDGENRIAAEACTNSQGRGVQAAFSYENGVSIGFAITVPGGGTFSRALGRDPHRPQLVTGCTNAFNGTALTAFGYGYDALSRATNRNDDAFAYNARSELTGAVLLTNCYGYVYDFIGNRLFSALNSATNVYAANSLNQYTAVTGGLAAAPTYDSDGNTTWDGRFSHSWDSENRLLKSIPGGTVTNGSVMVENRYDYLHRRVSKAVRRLTGRGPGYPLDPSQAGTWALVEARAFVYDGWNLIRETVSDTNGVTGVTEYFWGPDLSGTLQGAGGVGGLLAVSMNGSFYFPCCDNNGNVIAYADENGTLRAEYAYDAFGNTVTQTGDMADAFSYRFSTKYRDEETGLYYYGYRFYSPEFGRWMSRDPIGEHGGWNLCEFAGNGPINWLDKLGLFIIRPVAGSPRTKTNPDGSFGGLWASVVILPDEGTTSLSGTVLHMKHTEIHVADCDGKLISNAVQTVQKRLPTNNQAGWPLESGQFAPIYSNVAVLGGYGRCVKGRILVKAVWYHFANTGGLPPTGASTSDDLSGSLDNEPYPHGRVGSTSGWPSVSSGSYSDFGSLSIEINLNCSSPLYDIHATGRGLDSTLWEYRKDRWSDLEGSDAYADWYK